MDDIYEHLNVLTRLEIEYQEGGRLYQNLRSYIKCLDESRILIYPPNINGKAQNVKDGQKINIIINTPENIFVGESIVLSKELSDTAGYWISYPFTSHILQRREFSRAPLNLNTKITVFENSTYTNKREFWATTNDISGKGLSYMTDSPLTNYYDIECEITLLEGEPAIVAKCEHIYSKEIQPGKFQNAFAFVNIQPEDAEKIVQECFKHKLLNR